MCVKHHYLCMIPLYSQVHALIKLGRQAGKFSLCTYIKRFPRLPHIFPVFFGLKCLLSCDLFVIGFLSY